MKTRINKVLNGRKLIIVLSIIAVSALTTNIAFAQAPPPPPPDGGGFGGNNNQPGGGAPIGSGIGTLLILGAAYGIRKVYQFRSKIEE